MNINGWFTRPLEGNSTQRKHKILRCLDRHLVEIAGLQGTHFKDE